MAWVENTREGEIGLTDGRHQLVPAAHNRMLRLGLDLSSFAKQSMNSSGHTPNDIQSHLYFSFLGGHTADVTLHVKGGSWEAVYQLHRVVLIQAGFFRSLFTAGFLESERLRNSGSYFGSPPDEVIISFDDLNITRSAFEVCIARLYGGGPELFLSPSLVPTPIFPLTPSFYANSPTPQCPHDHHPATPRFLLSLLATSIYLSIPCITSQALSMILSSVGPYTVSRYLDFATGQGIGQREGDDPEAAVGLEDVGKIVPPRYNPQTPETDIERQEDDESDVTRKLSCLDFEETEREDGSSADGTYSEQPAFNYGGIGDKVGEACACWLMRWGADILSYEESAASQGVVSSESVTPRRPETENSRRRVSAPSIWHPLPSNRPSPRLWARGGLTASWASAVISSNDFFIKDEWERYKFATRVVDLRRRESMEPNEEKEWAELFQHGIHYSTMSFEELMEIWQDISPVTGLPYVPVGIIHSAHWMQSFLRHRIISQSPVTGASSPSLSRDKDLAITLSTADILATLSPVSTSDLEKSKTYYPVPIDSSQRIGDTDGAFATAAVSADQLLGSAPDLPGPHHQTPKQGNFFGILTPHYTAASCIHTDATGKARWAQHPPFRFAVEFWGVGQLLEKSRLHSHTIWYAGSLFNVYVQVVRKKGIQLGVYLHRQSSVDPVPRASAPPILVSTRAERLLNSSPALHNTSDVPGTSASRGHASAGSSSSISSVAFAVPGSPALPSSSSSVHLSPTTSSSTSTVPLQPYRDPRPSISAHFTISCPSATGSSLTRFSSSPDQFSISQSWGWKSSSLRTEDYFEPSGAVKARDLNGEASLRATVVLGLV